MSTLVVNEATCSRCGRPKADCTCKPVFNLVEEKPLGQPTWDLPSGDPAKRGPVVNRAAQPAGRSGEQPMAVRTWSF